VIEQVLAVEGNAGHGRSSPGRNPGATTRK
jgi:hypothetical protein